METQFEDRESLSVFSSPWDLIAEITRLSAELAECRARSDGLEADLAKTIGLLSKTAEIVCMEQLADVPAAVERLQADYRYMSNEYAALAAKEGRDE